jgi:MFS family permease
MLDRVVEWHLEHIRHIEEERALLLGFYGAIISILLSKVFIEKCCIPVISSSQYVWVPIFLFSLIFLGIMYKLNAELHKHWQAVIEYIRQDDQQGGQDKEELKRMRLLRCIKPLGRHGLIYAMTSVHKLVFTLILAITVYSFLQVLFLLNDLYLIAIIILIIFLSILIVYIMLINNKVQEQKVGKERRATKQLLKLILIIIILVTLIILIILVKEYLYSEYQMMVVLITIIMVALNYVISVVKNLREKEDVVCDIIDDD